MKTFVWTLLALVPVLACSSPSDEDSASPGVDSELRQEAATDLKSFEYAPGLTDPSSGDHVGGAVVNFEGSGFSRELFSAFAASGIAPTGGRTGGVIQYDSPLLGVERDGTKYFARMILPRAAAELSIEGRTRELRLFGDVVDALIDVHVRAGTPIKDGTIAGRYLNTRFISCATGVTSKSDRGARFCKIKLAL